jgi:phage tail tape-measure protein
MEKEVELSKDPRRNSTEWVREIAGYPMPVRQAMYSMMRRRLEDPTLDESTRQLADMIISTERTARTMGPSVGEVLANQRKGWVSKPKVIGYGAGGAIAGVLAGYLGTRAVAGEEEAARQMPLNVGFESIGAIPKIGGPVASVAALGLTAATGGDIWRTMFNIAGGFAGGAIGGTVGTLGGPVGSIAGSVAGGTAGSFAADSLYTSIFGYNPPSQPTVPANVAFEPQQKVKMPQTGPQSELQNQINILGG